VGGVVVVGIIGCLRIRGRADGPQVLRAALSERPALPGGRIHGSEEH
jgi:hypothetical protein